MTTQTPVLIRVMCPNCTAIVQAPARRRGTNANCPTCKDKFLIPVGKDTPPEPPPVVAPAMRVEIVTPLPSLKIETTERTWKPGIAVLLSFFIMGLGQIYKGEIAKGLLMIAAFGLLVTVGPIVLVMLSLLVESAAPMILAPAFAIALWLGSLYDAYDHEPKR